jgi:hypothetical protein
MILLMFLYYIMDSIVHILSTHYISHSIVAINLNVLYATLFLISL